MSLFEGLFGYQPINFFLRTTAGVPVRGSVYVTFVFT